MAGIYYQGGPESDHSYQHQVDALFIDKHDPCYKMLLNEGCDVTSPNADQSFSDTADGRRWYLNVELYGLSVRLLVDTGAEVSVLSREVYKRFSSRVDKSLIGVRPVKTANGGAMHLYGKLVVIFSVKAANYFAQPLIADITDNGILGMDWLRRFGAVLNPVTA